MIPLSDERAATRPALATIALIIACVVVYMFVQPTFGRDTVEDTRFDFRHAAIPFELTHGRPLTTCEVAQAAATSDQAQQVCEAPVGDTTYAPGKQVYLAVLVSMFLHGNLLHIAGNLLFLWVFGRRVEDRLGSIGFLAFYLAAGLIAAGAQVVADPSSAVPFIGASGAIAGVMGAYLVWFPRAQINTVFFVIVVVWFKVPARWLLLAWFVLQFFIGPNSDVAWVAHVGGFLFGVLFAWLTRPRRPTPTVIA